MTAPETGPPLDAHAARAELVDYIARLRREAPETHPDIGYEIDHIADELAAILRRWDIARDPARTTGAAPCRGTTAESS